MKEGGCEMTLELNTRRFAEVIDEILPGLSMYVRDVNLSPAIAGKYKPDMIIMEPGFTDASSRVMGMITTHRFAILSNHMVDLGTYEHDTNWGLFVARTNAHFKILDIYEYQGRTQILLLHLPDDNRWKIFKNVKIFLEDQIIADSRKRFENKSVQDPVPELAKEDWLERCASPLGICDDGEFFNLDPNLLSEQRPLKEQLREPVFLDASLHQDCLNDLSVLLPHEDQQLEQVWVRGNHLTENEIRGTLPNEPNVDFEEHHGDSIQNAPYKQDGGSIVCVSPHTQRSNKKWDNEIVEFLFPKQFLKTLMFTAGLGFLIIFFFTALENSSEKKKATIIETVREDIQTAINEKKYSEAYHLLRFDFIGSSEEKAEIAGSIMKAAAHGCWKGYGEWKTTIQDSDGECYVYFYYPEEGDALYISGEYEVYYLVFSETEFSDANQVFEVCQNDPGVRYLFSDAVTGYYTMDSGDIEFNCYESDSDTSSDMYFYFSYDFDDNTAEIRYASYGVYEIPLERMK